MSKPKKLQGGAAFDKAMGALVRVPKDEVDRTSRAWKKARAKKKRQPKSGD